MISWVTVYDILMILIVDFYVCLVCFHSVMHCIFSSWLNSHARSLSLFWRSSRKAWHLITINAINSLFLSLFFLGGKKREENNQSRVQKSCLSARSIFWRHSNQGSFSYHCGTTYKNLRAKRYTILRRLENSWFKGNAPFLLEIFVNFLVFSISLTKLFKFIYLQI